MNFKNAKPILAALILGSVWCGSTHAAESSRVLVSRYMAERWLATGTYRGHIPGSFFSTPEDCEITVLADDPTVNLDSSHHFSIKAGKAKWLKSMHDDVWYPSQTTDASIELNHFIHADFFSYDSLVMTFKVNSEWEPLEMSVLRRSSSTARSLLQGIFGWLGDHESHVGTCTGLQKMRLQPMATETVR